MKVSRRSRRRRHRQHGVERIRVARLAQACHHVGFAQQARDTRQRLEVIRAGAFRRKQQEDQIDRLAVDPVPEDVMTEQSYYLLGVYHDEDRMIILLDADKVLQVRDRDAVAASGR